MNSALFAGGLAAVLALSACGADNQPPAAPLGAVQPPSSVTSQPPSSTTPPGPALFTSVADLAKGIDKAVAEHKSATFTAATDGAEKTTMDGAYLQDGAKANLTMTTTVEGATMTVTIVDGTMYVKVPGLEQGQPGKSWLKVDPVGKDPLSRALAPMLVGLQDSIHLARSLEIAKDFTTIKESRADGEGTYYKLVVDAKKAAEQSSNGVVKQSMREMVKAGVTETVSEAWLNQDTLPVKVVSQAAHDGKVETTTLTFADWGKPVDIKAPPANQIGKLPAN